MSDIVIPKYLKIFNNKTIKHIILTSGRAGTKSSYAAIKADYQIIHDPNGSVVVMRKHHNFRVPWNMHSTHINYGIIYAGGRVFSLLLLTFICFARHYDIIFNSIIAANVSHITIRSQVGSCVLAEFSSVSLHYCRIANSTNWSSIYFLQALISLRWHTIPLLWYSPHW